MLQHLEENLTGHTATAGGFFEEPAELLFQDPVLVAELCFSARATE
jgi:hypothetical protein